MLTTALSSYTSRWVVKSRVNKIYLLQIQLHRATRWLKKEEHKKRKGRKQKADNS